MSNFSSGHVECSFDSPVENVRQETNNCTLNFPKNFPLMANLVKETYKLLKKMFFFKTTYSGPLEYNSEDSNKFFVPISENFKKLKFFQKQNF